MDNEDSNVEVNKDNITNHNDDDISSPNGSTHESQNISLVNLANTVSTE